MRWAAGWSLPRPPISASPRRRSRSACPRPSLGIVPGWSGTQRAVAPLRRAARAPDGAGRRDLRRLSRRCARARRPRGRDRHSPRRSARPMRKAVADARAGGGRDRQADDRASPTARTKARRSRRWARSSSPRPATCRRRGGVPGKARGQVHGSMVMTVNARSRTPLGTFAARELRNADRRQVAIAGEGAHPRAHRARPWRRRQPLPEAGKADVERAIAAARRAFDDRTVAAA